MAQHTSITPFKLATGGFALVLLLVLTLGTVAAVWSQATFTRGLTPADFAALRFTITQALVSAALSILSADLAPRLSINNAFVPTGI